MIPSTKTNKNFVLEKSKSLNNKEKKNLEIVITRFDENLNYFKNYFYIINLFKFLYISLLKYVILIFHNELLTFYMLDHHIIYIYQINLTYFDIYYMERF